MLLAFHNSLLSLVVCSTAFFCFYCLVFLLASVAQYLNRAELSLVPFAHFDQPSGAMGCELYVI